MKARLYYANQVVWEGWVTPFDNLSFENLPPDFYNGGYIKYPDDHKVNPSKWARPDGTPVLLEDVPKELLTLELLLNQT
jgi:hypothetical protein